jgi:hypothetical protein
VRRLRQDAGERSGTDGDHHDQARAKAADGGGEDKGADAEGGADLPDELLADGRTAHARDRDAVCTTTVSAGENPHLGAGNQRRRDDPAETLRGEAT